MCRSRKSWRTSSPSTSPRPATPLLINGKGEIVAMSEQAERSLKVKVEEIERNGLTYYYRSLSTSQDAGIRGVYDTLMADESGFLKVTMDDGENHVTGVRQPGPDQRHAVREGQLEDPHQRPREGDPEHPFRNPPGHHRPEQPDLLISLLVVRRPHRRHVLASFVISGTITKNLGQLSLAAERIAKKDYDINLDIGSRDEIGELGHAFTQMSREIKGYTEHLEDMVRERTEELEKALQKISVLNEKLTDENLRLSAELDIAKKLQLMVLPGKVELGKIDDLDIACAMNPADEVGGDYYDCFQTNGTVNIGIGDVTGHGLSAGVIMLMAQTAIKTIALMGERDIKRCLAMVNKVLYSNIERITEDRSMTLSLINYVDKTFTVAGQHEAVLVARNSGKVEVVETGELGMFVGFEPDITKFIGQDKIRLESGETLVLYTDGVTEAVNERGQEFGRAPALRARRQAPRPAVGADPGKLAGGAVRLHRRGEDPRRHFAHGHQAEMR